MENEKRTGEITEGLAYYMTGVEAIKYLRNIRKHWTVETYVNVQTPLAEKEEDGGTGSYEDDTYCAEVDSVAVKLQLTHKQFLHFCETVDSRNKWLLRSNGMLVEVKYFPNFNFAEVTIGG